MKQKTNKKEVTLIQLSQQHFALKPIYKVTKRFPLEGTNETELFTDLNKAKAKFKQWNSK